MTMTCELLPYLNYSWVVRRWKMFSFIVVRVVHDDSEDRRDEESLLHVVGGNTKPIDIVENSDILQKILQEISAQVLYAGLKTVKGETVCQVLTLRLIKILLILYTQKRCTPYI